MNGDMPQGFTTYSLTKRANAMLRQILAFPGTGASLGGEMVKLVASLRFSEVLARFHAKDAIKNA